MTSINVIAIDQRQMLSSGQSQWFMVFALPDGQECRAQISAETASALIGAPKAVLAPAVAPVAAPTVVPQVPVTPALVAWEDLPEESLPAIVKRAFEKLGVAPRLPADSIVTIAEDILDKFGEEEWEEVAGPNWRFFFVDEPAPSAPLPPPPSVPLPPVRVPEPSAPSVNKITWSDGSPVVADQRRPRTVPSDSFGYPIVDSGRDPGEFIGGVDRDEDGVGQL